LRLETQKGANQEWIAKQMNLTPYHARYFAHELTKRSSSASIDSLTSALADAQVDLNPHQVEAALFAFRSPLSRGAILADEVGLGKTIEAGILLSQRWAERRRHLLVICPANLRKQWGQELADKFFLPSAIIETKTFNESIKSGNLNPFDQPKIILCSYQFARTKDAYVRQTPWDLVVIDEAHRLRNVYKASNKIANAIKSALADRQKALLTATPLQNSLLELYGLVSIIDEFTFGDLKSFASALSAGKSCRMSATQTATLWSRSSSPTTTNRGCIPWFPNTSKTRLMGAFIAYLNHAWNIKHFFVLAPNLTIYSKLIADFTPGTSKYVFQGLSDFALQPPEIITGDNYESGRGIRAADLFGESGVHINIFNISKINAEVRSGKDRCGIAVESASVVRHK